MKLLNKRKKKPNKKAFTLIELLSVIIIIAVVALITIPIILGITAKVEKEAFKETVRGVYKAAGLYESEKLLDKKDPYCSVYNFSNDKESDYLSEEELDQIFGKDQYDKKQKYKYELTEKLSVTGKKPTEGIISNCNGVYLGKVGNGKYVAAPDGEDILVSKGDDLSSVDKNKAEIKSTDISTTATTITIKVEAEVGGYGKIKTYEYSINGGEYKKGSDTFTFENLQFNTEYEIGIKITTDSGMVTEKSVPAKTDYALLSVTANGYTGTYDGNSHGITVTSSEATIKYGTEEGTYDLTSSPAYTDAGTYTVYYEVTRTGYKTVTGSKEVVINKASGSVGLTSTSGSLTYPATTTVTASTTSGGTISCSSANTSVASCSTSGKVVTIKSGTTAGTTNITVASEETRNYTAASASYSVTVASGTLSVTANGYTGTYNGSAHGITVSSSGATIKYGTSSGTYNLTSSPTYTNAGTYTVYYQVSRAGYKTVTGSKNVVINKASGSITLSSTGGTMPCTLLEPFSVTVTNNKSGGTLSCSTELPSPLFNCSISGNKVVISEIIGEGCYGEKKTITSAATTNYTAASATYEVRSRGCGGC